MLRLPQVLTPHTVHWQHALGTNSQGKVYGPKQTIPEVQVVDKRKLIRSRTGAEVVSESQLYINLGDAEVEEEDLITIWLGTYRQRTTKIIAINTWDARNPRIPAYLEVMLE